jgi:predicted nucleic acid-binding Zn ribbon protein
MPTNGLTMALQPCTECGVQISDKAIACPQCGAAPDKPKKTRWWLLIVLVVFALLLVMFYIIGSSPAVQERANAKKNIDFCWSEPSFDPATARFVAGACEKMEADYREKYGRSP